MGPDAARPGAPLAPAPATPRTLYGVRSTPEEIEVWMTAPPEQALRLQRPLPNAVLKIVAAGEKEDGAVEPT